MKNLDSFQSVTLVDRRPPQNNLGMWFKSFTSFPIGLFAGGEHLRQESVTSQEWVTSQKGMTSQEAVTSQREE